MGKYAEYNLKPTVETPSALSATIAKNKIINEWTRVGQSRDFESFCSFIRTFSDFEGIKQDIYFDPEIWTEPQKLFQKNRSKFDIVLKPRRIGFTTLELIRDLFYALTIKGSTTVIVTQDEDLAKRTLTKIKYMIEGLEELGEKVGIRLIPERRLWSVFEISFATGSSIKCVNAKAHENAASKSQRGFGIDRLHCTEVAFWEYPDLTMDAILNAALNAEEIVIESTAYGAAGWFYDFYWNVANGNAGDKWKNHFYPWHCIKTYSKPLSKNDITGDSLRFIEPLTLTPLNQYEEILINEHKITLEQLKWWRETVARSKIEKIIQEFPINEETCFRSKSDTFLDQKDFIWLSQGIIKERSEVQYENCPIETPAKIWHSPDKHCEYIIGVDVSWGKQKDYSSFYIIDRHTGEICASFSSNEIRPSTLADLLIEVGTHYNNALLAIERNGPGNETIPRLIEKGYDNLYYHPNSDEPGFVTSQNSRNALFGFYQTLMQEKTIPIVDVDLINEAKTLIIKDQKIDHIRGAYSDRTMAFLIAQKARIEGSYNICSDQLFHSGFSTNKNKNMSNHHNFKLGRPRF